MPSISMNLPLFSTSWKRLEAIGILRYINMWHYYYYYLFGQNLCVVCKTLKGKFPQTTMWIGWVESNFRNPSIKVWADLDNPFKRSDYTKLRMSPSLDWILPEYVISHEDNSPLTLHIDFSQFQIFLDINSPFDQVQS